MRVHRRCVCAALAVGLLFATASVQAAPRPAGLRPLPTTAEAGIWDLSDKAEQHVRHSAELNTDPDLNSYVRNVACKVSGDYCADLRLYVLDRPFINATMMPNGYTEVWSGLLLRCQNEAELAFVLGHEASHFAENHSLERHIAQKNRANFSMALTVGVAVAGTVAAANAPDYQSSQRIMNSTSNLIDAIYLGAVASLFAFTREQESEADALGFDRAAAVGYDPASAPQIWRNIMAENAASDFERVRKSDARLSIFDSHPLNATRVAALDAAAKKTGRTGEADRVRYRAAIRPFLGPWLKDDLRRRDFGETLYLLTQLERDGTDLGVINFYRGEAYRLRNRPDDVAKARDAYQTAANHPDAPATVWRELGDAERKLQNLPAARRSLETYLARSPDAEDAWMVRETLNSLPGGA